MKLKFTNQSFFAVLLLLFSVFSLKSQAQQFIQVGSGTSTISNFPISSCMGYSYTQQVYLASELIAGGATGSSSITKIRFKITDLPSSWSSSEAWVVYLGNTNLAGFASSTSWIPVASMDEVFDGTTSISGLVSNDWLEITLQNPFIWDGTSNLVVAIDENTPSWNCTAYWQSFTAPATSGFSRGLQTSNDNTNPNPTSPPSGSTSNNIAQVQFEMTPTTPCSGMPSAGTVPASLAVCANVNFTVSATGTTSAGSLENQWQIRQPAGTGVWTTIPGTSPNLTMPNGISDPSDFRFITKCTVSNLSDTSGVIEVTINPASACYCIPSTPYGGDSYINSFTTTGGILNISNLSTGFTTPGYADYTTTDTLEAYQGSTIDFSTVIGTLWSSFGERIWIDFDRDGNFNNTNEKVFESNGTSLSSPINGSFTIPLTATPGPTRMRVRIQSYAYPDACAPLPNYETGEAEDYIINIIELPACANANLPSTVTASSNFDELCVSGDIVLNLDTTFTLSGITYQWESSTDGGITWVDEGTASLEPQIAVTDIDENTSFRCRVLCDNSIEITSNIVDILINDPQLNSTTDGTRCGPGSVELNATAPAGLTIRWYENASGGGPLGTGNSWQTPYISNTTTFYATAGTAPSPLVDTLGDGALVSTGAVTPFYGVWGGYKHQYIIRADELIALGLTPGSSINSIGFQVQTIGTTYNGFAMSVKNTTANVVSSTWETGLTEVYAPNDYTTFVGVNTFDFMAPFVWDGTNLIIQTCWSNNANNATQSTVRYDNTSFISTHYGNSDNATPAALCDYSLTGSTISQRPRLIIGYDGSCQGEREPVIATVTPGPNFEISYDTVVCNNAVTPITVSSPTANYASYIWEPIDNLYTNAAATTPYTGGSASTVYFKSDENVLHTYAVAADEGAGNCTAADTARIFVQPGNISMIGNPDTICVEGDSRLVLSPDTTYAPGSIKWQESANGNTYNTIPGADAEEYTTPILDTEHYYKAIVSAQAGVCETMEKHIQIANPVVISVTDSFHCGPGTVFLRANTGGNSVPTWYENEEGGTALGTGAIFETSYLTETDTFYLAASAGSSGGTAIVGSGASTSTDAVTPFYGVWGGYKHQYLLLASELLASGVEPGSSISSIALDVVSNGTTFNGFAIGMAATTATALNSTWVTTTEVMAPISHTTTSGLNTFVFDDVFLWDGVSNLVVQTCWSNNTSSNVTNTVKFDNTTFVSTHYGNQDNATPATLCNYSSTGSTLSKRPKFEIEFIGGCQTPRQAVIATIHPKPDVYIGDDIVRCVDSGAFEFLDAGNPGHEYLWNTGFTERILPINESGFYKVVVTNEFNCSDSADVDVTLNPNPIINLGNDTTVCEGAEVTLYAGDDGIQYFWNTGDLTSEIIVHNPGGYNVVVTSDQGCQSTDSITIEMEGQLPTTAGIIINNDGANTFYFSVNNPQNVVGYIWDFGDGSPLSYEEAPIHTYAPNGDANYVVHLYTSSTCGFASDSASTHITTDINDVNKDDKNVVIYPNPSKGKALIESKGEAKLMEISVYDVLGRIVYKSKAEHSTKHEINLGGKASGLYNVQIETDKGTINKKLEIIN